MLASCGSMASTIRRRWRRGDDPRPAFAAYRLYPPAIILGVEVPYWTNTCTRPTPRKVDMPGIGCRSWRRHHDRLSRVGARHVRLDGGDAITGRAAALVVAAGGGVVLRGHLAGMTAILAAVLPAALTTLVASRVAWTRTSRVRCTRRNSNAIPGRTQHSPAERGGLGTL